MKLPWFLILLLAAVPRPAPAQSAPPGTAGGSAELLALTDRWLMVHVVDGHVAHPQWFENRHAPLTAEFTIHQNTAYAAATFGWLCGPAR